VDRHARKAKSIGHTSVVFKIEQTDGRKIVWKPDSRLGPGRYRGEIAAYRLATLLGIDNVPPALPLDIERDELARAALGDAKAKQLFDEQVVFDGEVAHGSFTEWIDDYTVLPLETESQWRGWLKKDAAIPDDKTERAREASTLILFDYVTGNWDRWSGANVGSSNGRMLYVDNDGAFFESPPKSALARNKRELAGVDRFSKAVVEKVRSVSDEEIAKTLDILSKKAIDGVLARRKEALVIIEKKGAVLSLIARKAVRARCGSRPRDARRSAGTSRGRRVDAVRRWSPRCALRRGRRADRTRRTACSTRGPRWSTRSPRRSADRERRRPRARRASDATSPT
jgi:hypothetical protein